MLFALCPLSSHIGAGTWLSHNPKICVHGLSAFGPLKWPLYSDYRDYNTEVNGFLKVIV